MIARYDSFGEEQPMQEPMTGVDDAFVEEIRAFFSENGTLAQEGYAYRPQQQEMAVAVAEQLRDGGALSVEAGTGVGKSLAYLVPCVKFALETGRKAVISTHTINLQEQLVQKDIPMVQELLGVGFDAVLLKGRGNYLCPSRLIRVMQRTGDLFSTSETEELKKILEWSEDTQDGTLSDLNFRPSPKVWSQVCSESHACNRRTCGRGDRCFYQNARKRAEKAAVVVVNHTLFFTLFSIATEEKQLNDKAEGGYLFADDFVVFDEAHTIEDVAAKQLGLRLSHAGVKFDIQRLYHPRTKRGLLKTLRDGEAMQCAEELLERVDDFFDEIEEVLEFGDFGREVRVRRPELVDNMVAQPLRRFWEAVESAADDLEKESPIRAELMEGARRMREVHGAVRMFLDQEDEDSVYWVERGGGSADPMVLLSAPINVAERLRYLMFGPGQTCVLTSATLGAGDDDLGYFRKRVGAESSRVLKIGSPFDYQKQMEVYVMRSMPDKKSGKYEAAMIHWIGRVLKYTEGKAFVLFTSYKLMKSVASKMQGYFSQAGWQLLVQGEKMPRQQMVEEFKKDIHSVLFGTDSFWAGVDVPGEALSNVIVTSLPFAVPNHPLVECRIEAIVADGGNAFMDYSMPEAVVKLRQGVGRLIRSENDKGLVVILDSRVVTKRYGKVFLNALPTAKISYVNEDVT